ncbi:helix-turn-helix transcriptional regulator [Corynebacterium crudilactis]|uniref:ArsR family transcriptional regulator n=1 Tax=Corynebacterium crudilactis TaxID=1652495 RepID=A0A172QSS8_9CORY|nr:metalloregulator ArsR/SmtB family transcription factor [Corynebacterium crudilactis]ANE03755.1 ArsR family transcriptional regulator [Corynebacterium crudilactis]
MKQQDAPTAATELFAESYKLSPKQREVLDVLQTFPDGARAQDIAKKLDLHVNTARGHLEELVAKEAIRVVTAAAKGRGRPFLIFQTRVPDNKAVAKEYITLIELMANMLGDVEDDALTNPALRTKAREIGTQWAHIMGIDHAEAAELDEALSPLITRLREMGFDPTTTENTNEAEASLALHSCPFVVNDKRPSSFVCAIHAGFIQESLGSNNQIHLELKPLNAPGTCKVHVLNK